MALVFSANHPSCYYPRMDNAISMGIAPAARKLIFRKMERKLLRLSSDARPEAVHEFRTTSRRLETLLEQLLPVRDANQKKLLKMLRRIRRRAGKIRDIDVQIVALRSFRVPQEPRRKTQLMHRLLQLREQHERRLAKLLKKNRIRELRRKIQRAGQDLKTVASREPLGVANEILSKVSLADQVTDEVLHRYRLAVKRARYAAEFAPKSTEARNFIAGLEQLQDALGNWHDWMTLTNTASKHLGEVSQSSLVAALHNAARVKFRHAVAAVTAARNDSANATIAATKKWEPQHSAPKLQAA